MKIKRVVLWIIIAVIGSGILLWQSGAVNYFLARTIFAPNFENDLLPEEDSAIVEDPKEDEGREGEEDVTKKSIKDIDYEIEVIAKNLEIPWEIVHLPDGRILITERPGRLKVLEEGEIATIHSVEHAGEGGLLGMALSPTFEEDGYLYLYYTYREEGDFYNRVGRYTFEENILGEEEVIIEGIPGGRIHNGGRIKFGPDQMLYIATGDAGTRELAQDRDSMAGMILRLHPDGNIPEDNPFQGSPVYAYGIRNPQGLSWHPMTKSLYASGHGPTRLDMINRIHPGGNYGWPEITCDEEDTGYEGALVCYTEFTLAPSGMDFYAHEDLAEASLFVAGLRGNMVMRIDFNQEGKFLRQKAMFQDYGRIRTVVFHEGSLYITTSNRDGRGVPVAEDDRVIRITPILDDSD